MADRIWFGEERPLLGVRRAWEHVADELQRWGEELEAERAELCRSILGIELGDIMVQSRKGDLTRLQVTSTGMLITDEAITFIIEGMRFRRDGTVGTVACPDAQTTEALRRLEKVGGGRLLMVARNVAGLSVERVDIRLQGSAGA